MAGIASERLELQDALRRVAASLRRLVHLDIMEVVRIIDERHAVVHTSTHTRGHFESTPPVSVPLTAWSPRMRPRAGSNRFDDAEVDLDPAFPADARALEGGVRSGMWEPFGSTGAFRGGVWASACAPQAFTEADQVILRPIAALLGTAVEHREILDTERRRR